MVLGFGIGTERSWVYGGDNLRSSGLIVRIASPTPHSLTPELEMGLSSYLDAFRRTRSRDGLWHSGCGCHWLTTLRVGNKVRFARFGYFGRFSWTAVAATRGEIR